MWSTRSNNLKYLTNIILPKVNYMWIDIEKSTFDEIKWMLYFDTLLAYLVFNKWFDIHTNTRHFKLGIIIIHHTNAIKLYSLTITSTHIR